MTWRELMARVGEGNLDKEVVLVPRDDNSAYSVWRVSTEDVGLEGEINPDDSQSPAPCVVIWAS